MTVKIDAKVLLATLRKVVSAVEPHKLYDVLQCVRIEASGNLCTLTSFNLVHEIKVSVAAEGKCDPMLVHAATLVAWLAKVAGRADVVSVDIDGRNSIWRVGRASASIAQQDIASWASFEAFVADQSCVCSGSALGDACSSASAAVQDDPSRPYLSGVRIEAGSIQSAGSADRLVAVGTNGVMLVARDIPVTGLHGSGGAILSLDTVKALSKLLSGVETITLGWNAKRVSVTAGEVEFQASLIEAVFPERWRQSADCNREPHVSYDSRELSAAVASITTLASEEGERRFRGVRLAIGADETTISCSDAMRGVSGEDKCRHSLMEAPTKSTVSLAANQLLKIIGALDGETIQISVGNDNASPAVVSVAGKSDRIGFSVPLKDAAA